VRPNPPPSPQKDEPAYFLVRPCPQPGVRLVGQGPHVLRPSNPRLPRARMYSSTRPSRPSRMEHLSRTSAPWPPLGSGTGTPFRRSGSCPLFDRIETRKILCGVGAESVLPPASRMMSETPLCSLLPNEVTEIERRTGLMFRVTATLYARPRQISWFSAGGEMRCPPCARSRPQLRNDLFQGKPMTAAQ